MCIECLPCTISGHILPVSLATDNCGPCFHGQKNRDEGKLYILKENARKLVGTRFRK